MYYCTAVLVCQTGTKLDADRAIDMMTQDAFFMGKQLISTNLNQGRVYLSKLLSVAQKAATFGPIHEQC